MKDLFAENIEPSDYSSPTSDDAGFAKNIESEFDVTKSMLGERYVKQSQHSAKNVEKSVEIEAVAFKKMKNMIEMKKGVGSVKDIPVAGLGDVGSDHGNNIVSGETGTEGPKFRHLGGMNVIFRDLIADVIVPLCQSEVRITLGVRPTTGILLHGSPRCGKTKLAHAIANGTGVPFYTISDTEVVSGVLGLVDQAR